MLLKYFFVHFILLQELILSNARLQKELTGARLNPTSADLLQAAKTRRQQVFLSLFFSDLEGNILKLLSDASGDILEDEVLIQTLPHTQVCTVRLLGYHAQWLEKSECLGHDQGAWLFALLAR